MKTKSIINYLFVGFCVLISSLCISLSSAEQQCEEQKQDAVKSEPGLSFDNPIIINNKDLEEAEAFIIDYIEDRYPDFEIIDSGSIEEISMGGITTNVYTLRKIDEENSESDDDNSEKATEVELYFDVTIASEEFTKKNAAKIRELLKHVKIEERDYFSAFLLLMICCIIMKRICAYENKAYHQPSLRRILCPNFISIY